MLKLASVSLPFGKKSQTRQAQTTPPPAPASSSSSSPQPQPQPNAGSAEISTNSSHTNSGSVSLKRCYQRINLKLVQSHTSNLNHTPATSISSSKSIKSTTTQAAPVITSSAPSTSHQPNHHHQLASHPHSHHPLPSLDNPIDPNDPLINQPSIKPSYNRTRSSSSSVLNHSPACAHPNSMAANHLYGHDHPSQIFSSQQQLIPPSSLSPIGHSPSSILNYNTQQLSLLRRHHTLSTAGTHLARLEKEHALANMVEKDRRFYGGSDCETGSLSGSESLESLSLESRSNFCLTPLNESDHHHHHDQPRVLCELSDLIAQPQPPPPSRGTPLARSGFQLIRAYKGTATIRSQHLGPPTDRLAAASATATTTASVQTQCNTPTITTTSDTAHTVVPSHPQLATHHHLNTAPNCHKGHTSILEHRPGPQSPRFSGGFPLNQVALHRNFSSPSKLQHSSHTSTSSKTYLLPPDWKKVALLNSPTDLMKPTDSALQLLRSLQPTRSLSDGSRTFSRATEEEEADEFVDSSCSAASLQTANLHRATSDRVSSNVTNLNASQPPSSKALSHLSEQSNLRRHQSLKSDGRWGTCLITSPSTESSSEQELLTLTDSSRPKLDTFYEFGSSMGGPSTDLLRSASNHSSSSPAFPSPISTNTPPSGNIGSFSAQPGGIVTTMSSPVSVPGLSINPWSPSVEEAKKLREPMLRQASLDTLASNSSNGSHPMQKSNTSDLSRYRSCSNDDAGREMNLLHTNFTRINLGQSKNGDDLGRSTKSMSHRISGVKSPLSTSTSLADLSEAASPDTETTKPTPTTTKKVVLPPLVTDFSRVISLARGPQAQENADSIKRHPLGVSLLQQGPASAAAFVPPIGHSLSRNISDPFNFHEKLALMANRSTAAPGVGASTWLTQKERLVGESQSRQQTGEWGSTNPHSPSSQHPSASASLQVLPHQIQQQIILNQQLQQLQQLQAQQHHLQQQQVQLLNSTMGLSTNSAAPSANGQTPGMMNSFNYCNISPVTSGALYGSMNSSNSVAAPAPNPSRLQTTITGLPGLHSLSGPSPHPFTSSPATLGTMAGAGIINGAQPMPLMTNLGLPGANPFGVHELARQKGYNPINFDLSPKSARFFVIKSYTEEDVHKSLKYEIWASTDLGNKRLDRAFHESHESGPIYLLFSVNASGHFCGMAEMLTAVDYNTTSKVWAQDKWKGIFKVKWVFVKDIPNNALRHIKLSNTPENKPITSSRDTQEVPHDKGIQVLQIMSSYQSRTTLLQDYAWYEHNETLKTHQQLPESSTQVPVVVRLQGKNLNQSQTQADAQNTTGMVQGRHSRNQVQPAHQNIRRFTQAPSHPGKMAPVTVQVASGR